MTTFKPINDQVLIRVRKPSERLSENILHPHPDCGPWQVAFVLAVGPGAFRKKSAERVPPQVEPGDTVVTKWRAGTQLAPGESAKLTTDWIVREREIVGVVERCCGTCASWDGDPGNLEIRDLCKALKHRVVMWTVADDGTECPVWTLKDGLVS